ncbi:hypothetical protein B0H17DRAFT_1105269 [Mycena rosella]|uniref:Uncharacterized protein n=1 Tax=Mycena rosella TaxID=1033263 RepID=A0AAD7C723_MYCRO|nr:hypothetical protein B0H17DRAFT_1105269 [Mycena rosella]
MSPMYDSITPREFTWRILHEPDSNRDFEHGRPKDFMWASKKVLNERTQAWHTDLRMCVQTRVDTAVARGAYIRGKGRTFTAERDTDERSGVYACTVPSFPPVRPRPFGGTRARRRLNPGRGSAFTPRSRRGGHFGESTREALGWLRNAAAEATTRITIARSSYLLRSQGDKAQGDTPDTEPRAARAGRGHRRGEHRRRAGVKKTSNGDG